MAPPFIQALGRTHPMFLHLPIGLLIVLVLLHLVKKEIDSQSFEKIQRFILAFTALSATLTAMMGLFLSLESAYDSNSIFWHKWSGFIISWVCYLLLAYVQNPRYQLTWFRAALSVGVAMIFIAGHNGASITHGEDFLVSPLIKDEPVLITEETPVFEAAIKPILEQKCEQCHNENKAKGELIMTTLAALNKGGKNGPIWEVGNADNSAMIQRIHLPLEHDEHMPPKGKSQLTENEIDLLAAWINAGADFETPLKQYAEEDQLYQLASYRVNKAKNKKESAQYDFKAANTRTVEELNTPLRTLEPIALGSPALKAQIYIRKTYQKELLKDLLKVKEQLVELNLAHLPIVDEDLELISKFSNLEKLILNSTDISGNTLSELSKCEKLHSLALSSLALGKEELLQLAPMKQLKRVFIWNTSVTEEELSDLQKEAPHIDWDLGYIPDANELLPLSPPVLVNESQLLKDDEPIVFKHNFPGAVIRYTLDGSDPDSLTSPIFDKPLDIDQAVLLKTRAFREGWLGSRIEEFNFFKKGIKPDRAELLTPPNSRYKANGVNSIIDGAKGKADKYKIPHWLGYKGKPFAAQLYFEKNNSPISRVTLSYAQNIGAYIMPPLKVEVWGGANPSSLRLLGTAKPRQPDNYDPNQVKGASVDFEPGNYKCFKVVAKPVSKLPSWHRGVGDKGWVFVDEVLFY